eukprot:CAMPEP_0194419568 /NCGR_PEP_ID=MMETSP0176-20130528/18730_1 /TAXON_ID=216777 /ORGANISM="Proboscia alata, Strain PI-D3" /LENGTH=35 /DNA_ID= /DNA_START= /DNA_END= /DNA_ORIENTATION=
MIRKKAREYERPHNFYLREQAQMQHPFNHECGIST